MKKKNKKIKIPTARRGKEKFYPPDFIMVPYQIFSDPRLNAMDKFVYGIIYYYANQGTRRCFASNSAMAQMIKTTPQSISNSLVVLEKCKFISRTFHDGDSKRRRKEIIPLVVVHHLKKSDAAVSISKINSSDTSTDVSEKVVKRDTSIDVSNTSIDVSDTSTDVSGAENENFEKNAKNDDFPSREIHPQMYHEENQIHPQVNRLYNKNINKEKTLNEFRPLPPAEGRVSPETGQRFTDQLGGIKRFESIEDVPAAEVNSVLASFLPLFPGEFMKDKEPFNIDAKRNAVKRILIRMTVDRFIEIINKYVSKRTEKFCPVSKSIYDFCTYKFVKIESYVFKSAGDLYAQRSISTPEQRADSDAQIMRILEEARAKRRKAREEWEKTHPNG